MTGSIPTVSLERCLSLRYGTSAPYFTAISLISSLSVVTIILDILLAIAASIVHAIKGFPLNNLIFLFLIDFEPDLAGIMAKLPSILCFIFLLIWRVYQGKYCLIHSCCCLKTSTPLLSL